MNNSTDKLTYFMYVRKSTEDDDRQILSLDSQVSELKALAARNGLKIVKIFRESKSAKAPDNRPYFSEMMAGIERGEAEGILAWKIDRLSRNPIDSARIQWFLQKEVIKSIRTPDREYRPEDNALLLSVESGMANQYIRDLSKNVKRGLKAKLQMGWYPSRSPLGYLNTNDDKEKGRNEIIPDPERFELVKRLWQMMLTGNYTVMEILHKADKELGLRMRDTKKHPVLKPLSRAQLYKLFTNHFYYGYFEYGVGEMRSLYKGSHEPMITEDEFWRVQEYLGRNGRKRPQRKLFAFTGLMRCSYCKAMITAEEKVKRYKNGTVKHYIYYHCTKRVDPRCPEKMVELSELTNQIDYLIEHLTISDKFQHWAMEYLHEIRQNEVKTNDVILENKQKQHRDVVARLESLVLRFTSPENTNGGLISSEEYQTAKGALTRQKNSLETDLAAHGRTVEEWVELSERTFNFARYARMWFAKGDLPTKRAIFACLGSNLLIEDQKVAMQLHAIFKTLFVNVEQAEAEIQAVRTAAKVLNNGQNVPMWILCPTMRRG